VVHLPKGVCQILQHILAEQVEQHVLRKAIQLKIGENISDIHHYGTAIWNAWDRKTALFQNVALTATAKNLEEHGEESVSGSDRAMLLPKIYTYHGREVISFMNHTKDLGLFDSTPKYWVTSQTPIPFGGCFAPGTKVLVRVGSKNIDVFVTRLGRYHQEGICSNEKVSQAANSEQGSVQLFGFNGEKPFFSANHVFQTTTGLRALNPWSALQENSWANFQKLLFRQSSL
jgi:hypothetical protein